MKAGSFDVHHVGVGRIFARRIIEHFIVQCLTSADVLQHGLVGECEKRMVTRKAHARNLAREIQGVITGKYFFDLSVLDMVNLAFRTTIGRGRYP
mgnify:CR=1 FL=1